MLGEPGHGKSSFCKKMVYEYCKNGTSPKMFYFSLNPNDSSIIDKNKLILENIFKIEDIKLGIEELRNSIVFLDGFDELYMAIQDTNCKNINDFLNITLKLSQKYNFKAVVTSRKSCINIKDKRLFNKNIPIINLAGLTYHQQKNWIEKYNKLSEIKYDINKLEIMYENERIKELIQIPILFQLIVDNDVDLNIQNQVELYNNIFEEIIICREHETIRTENEFTVQNELEQIAFSIFKDTDKHTVMKNEDLEIENAKKLRIIISFYFKNEIKSNIHIVEFIHRSFYQYYLAYYIYHNISEIKKNQDSTELRNFLKKLWYRKLDRDTLEFVEQISKFEENTFEDEDIRIILDEAGNMDSWCVINEDIQDYQALDENINQPYEKQTNIFSNILSILCFLKIPIGLDISNEEKIITLLKMFKTKGNFEYIKIKSDSHHIDLSRIDLSYANLNDADLSNVNLSSANLINANLVSADLSNANLVGADLSYAYLYDTYLNNANLINGYLFDADLSYADLSYANLIDAYLYGADLSDANLSDANLRGANLRDADLSGADLSDADLTNADLTNADLSGSYLINTNLTGTDIIDANLDDIYLDDIDS